MKIHEPIGAAHGPSRRRGWRTRPLRPWLAATILANVLTWSSAPGPHAESSGRLAVIAHPGVAAKSLGASELASIFTRATRNWKDGTPIRPLNLPPGSTERVVFDRVVLHLEPDQSAQYWVDRMVRGEEAAPKAIAKADIVLRLVPTLPGAIAYVPEEKVDEKVKVLAFVRDGKVVAP
jgi:ABC-type phosphate transport system substrate-binding protein